MENNLNIMPKRLLDLMTEANLTQTQLADKVGTSQPTISKYLNGHLEPDIAMILKLCYALGTTPDELLCWDKLGNRKLDSL